jgi:hypothetical protein
MVDGEMLNSSLQNLTKRQMSLQKAFRGGVAGQGGGFRRVADWSGGQFTVGLLKSTFPHRC